MIMKNGYYKQDDIYIQQGKKIQVKELYKEIQALIEHNFSDTSQLSILDVGCASGELLYYLKSSLGVEEKLFGFDASVELVENANTRFNEEQLQFFVDDAQTFSLSERFDVIIMKGVLTIFDEFQPSLDNIIQHLKPKGIAIIVSVFNDYDIDVRITFRKKGSTEWNTGYNLFPLSDIKEFIAKKGCTMECKEHIMPFDLSPQDNPIRAWTVTCNGKRYLTNGLNLLYNMKLLTIKKS